MRVLAFVLVAMIFSSAPAVEPDEMLADPVLEERARNISRLLRCLVCQNESIDESNALLAKDLRVLVRELLQDGMDEDDILDHVASRYGEFVLFKPTRRGANWLLYLAGPAAFLLALLIAATYVRARQARFGGAVDELDAAEQIELERIAGHRNAIDDLDRS